MRIGSRHVIVLLAALSLAAAKPVAASKEQKVRTLLELTGGASMGSKILEAMLSQIESQRDAPAGFGDEFRALAAKDDLLSRLVPIYVKNLTDADIDGAIAFYRSPAGRDLAKAQPIILQQSMDAGQLWGQELAKKAADAAEAKAKAPAAK